MSNEATDGLSPSVFDSFRMQRGRLLTSFRQRVKRTRDEKPRVRTRILLPRLGAPARRHYRPKEPRTEVPRTGHCTPTNVQRGYRRVGTVGFCHFSGALRADSRPFPPTREERPEARNYGFGFASCSRGLVFPDGDIAGPNCNTAFDPSLEYSTDKVVLFWQPPSYFLPWSPSSFAENDVPYSCAEQYMMAEKTRLFQDHRAVGLIMTSPSPSTRKRIGRGVRNFDSSVEEREKQNAVLSGTYAKFTQNPAIKNHFLSSDNKLLTESSPLNPVWGIGLRADGPRVNSPCQARRKTLSVRNFMPFAKLFAIMRPGGRTWRPLFGSAPALRMQEPRNLVCAAAEPLISASARKVSPSAFPTYFLGALAD